MKLLALSTIQQDFPNLISDRLGNDNKILGFASAEVYLPDELIFLDGKFDLEQILANPPTAVVTTSEQADKLPANTGIGILVCEDVRLAHALIRQHYDDRDLHDHEWPRIHPSASNGVTHKFS